MKKRNQWLTIFLVPLLLTACGSNPEPHEDDHSAKGGEDRTVTAPNKAHHDDGQHSGDGTHTGKEDEAGNEDHAGHGNQSGEGSDAGTVKVEWTLDGGLEPKAGQDTTIAIEISDDDGQPVEDFEINHEKQLHLIIVSKDLSYFHHIHPEYKGGGLFEIRNEFPAGGDYKLIADFILGSGSATTKAEWVSIAGEPVEPEVIVPDKQLVQTAAGKQVDLSVDQLAAGQDVTLSFRIQDEKTKEPVNDLQPYLGAVGHVVIMSEDAEQYLHVHPVDEDSSGPSAEFMTNFPKSGTYKIWGQFQHNNEVFTVSYVVEVP